MDMFSLEGKTALITGGSHGIGFTIATALAMAGAKIAFNSSRQCSVERGVEAYRKLDILAKGYLCDVTDEIAVQAMVKEIGNIDILVNNAGVISRTPMVEMSAYDFRRVVDVDLVGPYICAKAVLPGMIVKGHGKIINICSLMSELGRATVSAYAAAKGGLKMLTRNIATEYGHYNIQCNGIGPGYIATEQTAPLRPSLDGYIVSRTPAGRWGTPDDLAGTAIFLASEASNFVNGQIIYVDGGILASL